MSGSWATHPEYRARYEGLDADPDLARLTWVRLRSPREVRRWLRYLDLDLDRDRTAQPRI